MDLTANLSLPYLAAAQAQKHVTHNEALRALDAVVQLAVEDRDLAVPPSQPTDGDRYIVASDAQAAWAGHELEVTAFQDGAWFFYQPREGWVAWVQDEAALVVWDGADWVSASGAGVNPVALVGINTTATTGARLAVKSDSVLLSHEDPGFGSGDSRLFVNKSVSGRTASLVFQTGFSGRAEIGTAGDDRLSFKASMNGSTWVDAVVIDPSSGALQVGGSAGARALIDVIGDDPTAIADVRVFNYGALSGGQFHGYMARGTAAAPSAVQAGDVVTGYGSRAYHTGGWPTEGSGASIHFVASENQTVTGHGTYTQLKTTANGTVTPVERVAITQDGTLWAHDAAAAWDPRNAVHSRPLSDTRLLSSASAESGAASNSIGVLGYGLASVGFRGLSARGTISAPSASLANDFLCFMGGHGHDGTAFVNGTKALVGFKASQAWTPTANGSYITFETTPDGSTVRGERMRVSPTGTLEIKNAVAVPTANVSGGGVLYVDAGALKFRGANGTVTTIASA